MEPVYSFTKEDIESVLDDLDLRLRAGELEEARELVKMAFEEREHEVAENALVTFQETLRLRREGERQRIA